MMKRIFLTVCLIFYSAILSAADLVGQVRFQQQGNFTFSEEVLRCNVQTKKGLAFSDRVVNDDVRRLYALGVFSDVVSVIEDLPDGKKSVTFRVTPKPVVSAIEFSGNKKFKTEKLKEQISVSAGSPLNDMQLADSLAKLRSFYKGEGLNDADISFRLDKEADGSTKLVFLIQENLRLRIRDVTFEGATVYTEEEMSDALESRYSFFSVPWLSWLPLQGAPGLLDREAVERDKVRLRELYWRKGYLDFKVLETTFTADEKDPEQIDIHFKVEEGEPYFLGKVSFTGNKRFTEEEIAQSLPFTEDAVYSSTQDDAFVKSVEGKYRPLGYADFAMRGIRHPNYETHTVDLNYEIYEGPPYTIGEVYISGNKWTKDHVIRREILVAPDDPLNQDMIDITKNRLLGMGYFEGKTKDDSGVDIVTVKSPDDPLKKDVHINVKEKRFIDGKIGAGWSSDDSLAGMIELSHSNMDILDPMNYFTGGGQRLRIMALAGVDNMGLEADFTEPWLFGIPLRLDISGYWRNVRYEDWDERRIGFGITLTKRIFDDFTSISGGYTFEQVRVHDMAQKMSKKFQDQEGNELVGRIFLTLDRDTRNSITNPTSGYFVSGTFALTSRGLGATNDYYKFELRGINYYPFFHDWFVLSTGFKVGSIGTFDSNKDVPLFDRYFLGGSDSIRGFPYRSIGPVDENEDNYGGQFMYILTAELSHPIWNMIRGAFFVDVGDATSGTCGPINNPNIGLGYGLRIKVPHVDVPIRLDLAYPVLCNQEGVSKKLRFHFNMGFSF